MFASPEASKTAHSGYRQEKQHGWQPKGSEAASTKRHQAGLRTIARKRLTLRPGSDVLAGLEGFEHASLTKKNGPGCLSRTQRDAACQTETDS
jgi:hypothetical protein